MINWNKVTVGETELVSTSTRHFLVMARRNGRVWLQNQKTQLDSVHEESVLLDWTIYDPWEDVSQECRFDDEFCVYHGHHMLIEDDIIMGRYKRDEAGLRVWKRKESRR